MNRLLVSPMEPISVPLLEAIEDSLREGFPSEVVVDPSLGPPDYAFDAKRNQYSAPLVLQKLIGAPVGNGDRRLAVTLRDLFIPMLSFVYGQAQLGGTVAVVSMARLDPEFYGLTPDSELLAVRARKEAIHETGHMFGLVHCPDSTCAMALSTNIRQLDLKRPALCRGCALAARNHRIS